MLSILTIDYFRTFTKDFIDVNPQIFLNFEWMNIAKLKIFIELGASVEMGAVVKVEGTLSSTRDTIAKTEEIEPMVVKKEPVLDEVVVFGMWPVPFEQELLMA
ncbi:hypothetical protein K443DRAFT_121332 [Laccaria amethystina LaAM-08-1]|uniref:Unplaced genomic scaffold K443scaffold_42, whole genome shotgun sequence n=1 Tax=Laccaria amethystina LaAM-08-1 TaxID=1095629 RepID=A0A0C9XPZ3_9AGAR|nr:hypothetical protein K443DRAFT_121332 [Laccaria amethystina LaAM-08-1]